MNKQKRLLLGRSIFVFIVFVSLGVIVVTEKAGSLLIPKVEEKLNNYLKETYTNKNFSLESVSFQAQKYKAKAVSKENKNHYFYVFYENKKITDTYKKDYEEGTTLLSNTKKELKKSIKEKTNLNCDIEILSKLNDYTDGVRERIINNDNLLALKFYTIKKELIIKNWTEQEILTEITSFLNSIISKNITPKYFTIILTNEKDITESIEISNITEKFLTNPYQTQIINAIMNDDNSKILKQNKITYKYLN